MYIRYVSKTYIFFLILTNGYNLLNTNSALNKHKSITFEPFKYMYVCTYVKTSQKGKKLEN